MHSVLQGPIMEQVVELEVRHQPVYYCFLSSLWRFLLLSIGGVVSLPKGLVGYGRQVVSWKGLVEAHSRHC